MVRHLGLAVGLFVLIGAGGGALWYHQSESGCRQTNRCQDRLQAIQLQLEQYSVDKAVEVSRKRGGVLAARSYYPKRLEDLYPGNYLSEPNSHCPSLGARYAYRLLGKGQSYLLLCPGPHTMHFSSQAFKTAVMPDDVDLKLCVQGGKVVDLCGPIPARATTPPALAEGETRRDFQDMRKSGARHENPWLPGGTGYQPNPMFLDANLL